jgi:phage repressor protein C with HTH and peptisase S24 domain
MKMTNEHFQAKVTERIEEIRKHLNLSKLAFCEHIGFSYSNYSQITGTRGSKPNVDLLYDVVRATGANPLWLLSGEGEMFEGAETTGGLPPRRVPPRFTAVDDRYVLLPLYAVQGSAGGGQIVETEDVEDHLAFKREWITRELRARPEELLLIYVQGESMVPTLNPGDVILLERYSKVSVTDGIYVIRTGNALLVKRLQFMPGGDLWVTSDNTAYKAFQVNLSEETVDFQIIGRVVWAGRRF